MWLKILGIVTFPSIIAWLTRIFWPKIWTTDVKGQVTCHNYGEKGPGSACHRICPLGYFHLPTMDEQCHPWLTCHDLRNDIVKVKVIGAGAVKKVSVATWKGHMVAMNEPVTELYLKDYRYGLDILKKLQGHLEVIQFIGSCNDVYVTQYHRFGSADQIGNILGDLNSGHKDTMATRFILCLNYVAILNFLHTNTLGTLVMCDSNDLEKTLKQYLITDDLMLVLNDIDSLAKVNHSAGELIKCGHRELGGEFVAPEQLWPYDAEFTDDTMPPYDEKSDIWKIPDVCNNFIIGHRDSMKVQLDLFGIHSACKEDQASHRPKAADILREYERVWNSIDKLYD
ncbi:protein O-mannose kinase-like [Mizuhopecten yessoensis]|uniref:Protein O-mannose kinase n=1 Tax=Mizuhopecten yessoensis TaxID=6573 RepID=A0A210PYD3_MIZYE|nr:protein O-mannose kinase-like [Mizuhopecten yessoensis]XP_021371924.1 protein O-mannose kinase-like [Mizuhopecten yessoensis]OWF41483.1 Inactive protein kinase-like protein [Mizuhopecten yessoensis]